MAAPVPAGIAMRDLTSGPPPGVGPYRSVPARPGTVFVLERRRGFRLPGIPAGRVDEVSGEVVDDPDAQSRAAIDSRVDVAEGEPPVDLIPRIRSELKDRYSEHPTLALDYLSMDVSQPPFASEDMRRAVSYAIDEAELKRLRDGFLEPTCNVVVPQVVGYRTLDPCPYGEREDDSDRSGRAELVQESARQPPPVIVSAEGGRAGALERYLVQTLDKVGFRARRARTLRDRLRAQVSFARVGTPTLPLPGQLSGDSGRRRAGSPHRPTGGRGPGPGLGRRLGGARSGGGGGSGGGPLRRRDRRRADVRADGRRELLALPPGLRAGLVEPVPASDHQIEEFVPAGQVAGRSSYPW